MADMTRIKGRIAETIYPNGTGAITAESHQALLLEMVDTINREKADQSELVATQESLDALADRVDNLPQGGGDVKADGVYPDLTAGDLAGRGESVPAEFGFRASGGKSIKDGRAYIKRIKGNSVVWNQLIRGTLSSSGNTTITNDGDVWTIIPDGENVYPGIRQNDFIVAKGCKYLVVYETLFEGALSVGINMRGQSEEKNLTSGGSWISDQRIIELNTVNNNYTIILFFKNAKSEIKVRNFIVIDLTKMFGAGYEPTTIEEFNARVATLGIDMYAYNEGEVIHCNTESIKSVGDNAWDEEWEVGSITDGVPVNNASRFRSKNYISVLPNSEYYITPPSAMTSNNIMVFYYDANKTYIEKSAWMGINNKSIKTPSNARYIKFVVAENPPYKNDIMISLVHSGWKQDTDAGYQPYWRDTLPLPIISKYFPDGMKSAGSAHDEIRYNKTTQKWEKVVRIGEVDLGDLDWKYYETATGVWIFYTKTRIPNASNNNNGCNIASPYYNAEAKGTADFNDRSFRIFSDGLLYIRDDRYTDANTFKAAMQGVILYYESNDWEWVELDAEDQNFRDYYQVADFGTEEAIPATDAEGNIIPSAAFSADIIYQFNAVDMIREHELEITELQKVIVTMQSQLASLTSNNA